MVTALLNEAITDAVTGLHEDSDSTMIFSHGSILLTETISSLHIMDAPRIDHGYRYPQVRSRLRLVSFQVHGMTLLSVGRCGECLRGPTKGSITFPGAKLALLYHAFAAARKADQGQVYISLYSN